jgi:IS5 family transposase
MKHRQPGLFAVKAIVAQLTKIDDSLVGLKARIYWKVFHPELERLCDKDRKDHASPKPFDVVVPFKILMLPFLNNYNLSDVSVRYQIRERFIFMRFLVLQIENQLPESKMVWAFREMLKGLDLAEVLFVRFHEQLAKQGFMAQA